MSDFYLECRLYWYDGRGAAKKHGRRVVLRHAPDLGSGPVAELDYAPALGCREIRRKPWGRREDMTRGEAQAAEDFLDQKCMPKKERKK